jgi:multiple sugar transport system permease protein
MSAGAPPARPGGSGPVAEVSDFRFALLVSLPVLLFLLLVVAYPLGYALWMSFYEINFFGGYSADFVGLKNYAAVLHDAAFWHSLIVSLRFTAESVVLSLLAGLGMALTLHSAARRREWLRAIVIAPWAVSPYGAGIIFSFMARGQTGIGTVFANWLGVGETVNLMTRELIVEVLAVGNAWNTAPLVAFFLLANIAAIPRRLYDLAAIDRMTRWDEFRHVTLPPLRFTLYVFACIETVFAFKILDYIITMSRGGPGDGSEVLTYQLYKVSFINLDLGYGAAMSFYLLLLILLTTFLIYLVWGRKLA